MAPLRRIGPVAIISGAGLLRLLHLSKALCMLVRLFGENFRSLRAPFELSLVAAEYSHDEDGHRGLIEVPITGLPHPLRLLRVVGIYGANAAGKSTVLLAGHALRWLATESSRRANADSPIPPYEPFALDETTSKSPVSLGCDFIIKRSLYRYEVQFTHRAVIREQLQLLSGSRPRDLIIREESVVNGTLISRSDANQLYVKSMQPQITVLSKLAQHGPHTGPDSARPYHDVLRESLRYHDYSGAAAVQLRLGSLQDTRFADDNVYRQWIMHNLLQKADIGICGVETRKEDLQFPAELREQFAKIDQDMKLPDSRVVISFMHKGNKDSLIGFGEESAGTKKLFNISNDWWRLANTRTTLLADELGASLHPRLLDKIVREVNKDVDDCARSQLLFATHDTGLLESRDGMPPALRRDQVYFAKKDAAGGSELYSLAEFKDDARSVHNIRKRYLSGVYGALPSVEGISL